MRVTSLRLSGLAILALSTGLVLTGCPADPGGTDQGTTLPTTFNPETGPTTDPETGSSDSTTDTSGDGDPGDGDPGDGDPGDGDPGDGDPGDGDPGDGDPDNCSDSDSGNAPYDEELDIIAPEDDELNPNGPMGFVPANDIPANECDIFMQDCPMGEKCVPYASMGGNWDADKCVPVMGMGMAGESCVWGGIVEATDDCDADSACWDVMDVNGMSIGVCTPFCTGTPDAPVCPPGTSCLQGSNGAIAFCVDTCNPLTQECGPGEACFWAGDAFNCIFTTQDIGIGQPCGYINDCAEGLMCVSAGNLPNCAGSACCAEFCDLDCGANVCSTPGTTCTAFYEMGQAPMGDADVGVCLTP